MYISVFRKALLCASFIIFSIAGYATPLTWTVDFGGPQIGQVVGTFTYDLDAPSGVSSWDVFGFVSMCQFCGGVRTASAGGTSVDFFMTSSDLFRELRLELSAPITDAGGTIPLIPGSCTICGGPGYLSNPDFSGSGLIFGVVSASNGGFDLISHGTISAAPEPEYGFCIALLLLTTAAAAQYKSRRRSLLQSANENLRRLGARL